MSGTLEDLAGRTGNNQGKMSIIKEKTSLNTLKSTKAQSWCVATKLQMDMIVEVDDVLFHLHKFPLLSKSGRLNKLVFEGRDTEKEHIKLDDFPGGPKSFELAAKFCYRSIPIHMTASNVVSLRCAAEYLEMREDYGVGNLISRTEEFLTYALMVSWLDSITILNSCAHLSPWAEHLHTVHRCVDSIACKATTHPTLITWSFTPSPSTAHHHQLLYNNCMPKYKLDLQGLQAPNCSDEGHVQNAESTDETDNGGVEMEKVGGEVGNLKRYCESIEQQMGSVWRPSLWKFPLRKQRRTIRARSNNGTPLPSPHNSKEGPTWNPVKWRRNSL